MDGDIAPLPALVELARAHDAVLVLDEAHATGVLGPAGEGALARFGIDPKGIVIVGTLSKALASAGGFVAAGQTVIDYLMNRSRPFIFNTALPPPAWALPLPPSTWLPPNRSAAPTSPPLPRACAMA